MTSKLAASGYWTSKSFVGPTIHLFGLIFILPIWHLLVSFIFNSTSQVSHTSLLHVLPPNLIAIALCKGIPSLRVAAFLGITIGLCLYRELKHKDWKTKVKNC